METRAHAGTHKWRWETSPSERALTARATASKELPASATKPFVGPGQIFKRENKMLCWLLRQKIITSALRQPFCIVQQVGRTVPDAGRGLCQIAADHMLLVHCQPGRKGVQ